MQATPHTIGLAIRNPADREVLHSVLQQSGYPARSLNLVDATPELWRELNLVIVDEPMARAHLPTLLATKRRVDAAFLPLLIALPARADSARWLTSGFDDVLRLPLTRADLTARIEVFLRLRAQSEWHYRAAADQARHEADQRAISAYERLLDRLAGLAQSVGTAHDLPTIFRSLHDFVTASSPADGLFASLYDPATGQWACVYASTASEEFEIATLPPAGSPHSRAIATGETIVTDDLVAAMAGRPSVLHGQEIDPRAPRSLLIVPMSVMGHVIGAFEVRSVMPGAFCDEHVVALRMAANLAAIAIENAQLLAREVALRLEAQVARDEVEQLNVELERRVSERTAQLAAANQELEAFSYSVSHDLRVPLRAIDGFSRMLTEEYGAALDADGLDALRRIRMGSGRMSELINALLDLSRLTRAELRHEPVDLSAIAHMIAHDLQQWQPERVVEFQIVDGVTVCGDARLLTVALENLIGNAWKFTAAHTPAHIEFGVDDQAHERVFYVGDDGAGFDPDYAGKLFGAFQRLHTVQEFAGVGVGLATVRRIVQRHGGRIWAIGAVEQGAKFCFTLS